MEYLDENALIVLEVNGETLRPSQGYPAAIWVGGGAAGAEFPKYVSSITISTEDDADKLWTHPRHGTNVKPSVTPDPKVVFYPNAGVLNYPTNVVLNDQVGKRLPSKATPTPTPSPSPASSILSTAARLG